MNKEIVKHFISSSKAVMESFGVELKEKDITVRHSPFKANSLVVVIGITGALHGQTMLSFDNETACNIASAMMGGMPVEMDEITKSAIAELANMIIGNAVTLLSQNNVLIDITPPSILFGENIHVSTVLLNLSVMLELENGGEFEFSITAKELSQI